MRENVRLDDALVVHGLGLCTPIGLSASATRAAVRAGLAVFSDSDALDEDGDPLRYSALELFDTELTRTQRLTGLGARAIVDALTDAPASSLEAIPMFLGLAEVHSGAEVDEDVLVGQLLAAAAPHAAIEVASDGVFRGGRAAFFECVSAASRYLGSRAGTIALVGAVDSLCDEVSLDMLARKNRVLATSNPDGVIPGEGAGFVLFTSGRGPHFGTAHARVLACTLGAEAHHFDGQQPNLAEGLTSVFRQLRLDPICKTKRVDLVFSCQTGESFWAEEFAKAYLRNESLFPEPLITSLIAESLGDVGAGSGAVQFAVALHALTTLEPRDGPKRALIYGCSDRGSIGSCVVEQG